MVVLRVERKVRVQHTHERHVFKIQPLGNHLRAKENGDILFFKFAQQRFMSARRADGVGVHTQHFSLWEQVKKLLLDLLCAGADALHQSPALAAPVHYGFGVPAVMAHQPFVGGMVRHRHAAPRTLRHVAALAAQQHPRAAAPVEKQNALLPALNVFFKLCTQRTTD